MVTELNGYFDRVKARDPRWASYNIRLPVQTACPGTVSNIDVVVYLVPDPGHSVFQRFHVSHSGGHGGFTALNIEGHQRASEVYVRTDGGTLLAKVAFHEILHNKTGWGNGRLHHHHRGGISSATIGVDTPVVDADLDLMGSHLGSHHAQWTGGCP
jgi:hypothetical protein